MREECPDFHVRTAPAGAGLGKREGAVRVPAKATIIRESTHHQMSLWWRKPQREPRKCTFQFPYHLRCRDKRRGDGQAAYHTVQAHQAGVGKRKICFAGDEHGLQTKRSTCHLEEVSSSCSSSSSPSSSSSSSSWTPQWPRGLRGAYAPARPCARHSHQRLNSPCLACSLLLCTPGRGGASYVVCTSPWSAVVEGRRQLYPHREKLVATESTELAVPATPGTPDAATFAASHHLTSRWCTRRVTHTDDLNSLALVFFLAFFQQEKYERWTPR